MSPTASAPARTEMMKDPGLANTITAETRMSFIDGQEGVLEYVGIDIDALARNSTFEETVFLLWNARLPKKDELESLTKTICAEYEIPEALHRMIAQTPTDATPMHALRTLVSALSLFDPEADDQSEEANKRKAVRLVAKMPTIVAAFDRHRRGESFVKPDPSLDVATNFLNMLNGKQPTDTMARALDVCLILHADHGFNASTFAARVTVSTLSDIYSAITSAIGALKGPLHGGANERVMKMLQEIGVPDKVEPYVRKKLDNKERVMGFGHRVYKAYDPRATYLKTFAEQIARDTGNEELYQMSHRIEQVMHDAVADKGIHPNVDFYSATTYYSLGLAIDLFTPLFAMSRVAGWCGHCIEQLADNKLIRPRADYVGPHDAPYTPIDQR